MIVLAEFSHPGRIVAAARDAHARRFRIIDSFTPYPIEELSETIGFTSSRIRVAIFIGGVAMAAAAYALEYYSAAIAYPYNSGGRPFNAWPALMLVPFATGILLASISGFVAFLAETGLPRLHHPLFAIEGFERASQDRFLLALAAPDDEQARVQLFDWLRETGATAIREVES